MLYFQCSFDLSGFTGAQYKALLQPQPVSHFIYTKLSRSLSAR
jgi:hypothetical protein